MKSKSLRIFFNFIIIFLINLLLFSCNKEEKIESDSEAVKNKNDSLKNCCEKKPSRFGSSDSINASPADSVKDVNNIQSQGTKTNSSHIGMVWIPVGEFIMGTNEKDAYDTEKPAHPLKIDGFAGVAPEKSFDANCYGLYDLIANVWEWKSDWYDANAYSKMSDDKVSLNPKGPVKTFDPEEPYSIKRVVKGGSFLCSENYCVNYRPSARRGQAYDSGTSNIGFRCVSDQ